MSTVMTRPEIDAADAEAFAGRFVTALNNAALGRGAFLLRANCAGNLALPLGWVIW